MDQTKLLEVLTAAKGAGELVHMQNEIKRLEDEVNAANAGDDGGAEPHYSPGEMSVKEAFAAKVCPTDCSWAPTTLGPRSLDTPILQDGGGTRVQQLALAA